MKQMAKFQFQVMNLHLSHFVPDQMNYIANSPKSDESDEN